MEKVIHIIKDDDGNEISKIIFTEIPTVIKSRYYVSTKINSMPCDLIELLKQIPNGHVLITATDESQSDDGETVELVFEKEILQG